MIQRVQTMHLFLAIISAVLFFTSPYGTSGENSLEVLDNIFLTVFTVASIVVSAVTIMKYNNRKSQKKMIWLGYGIVDVLILILLYQFFFNEATRSFKLDWGIGFLVFIPIFLAMAMRGINKDEKIIKSMDRLR